MNFVVTPGILVGLPFVIYVNFFLQKQLSFVIHLFSSLIHFLLWGASWKHLKGEYWGFLRMIAPSYKWGFLRVLSWWFCFLFCFALLFTEKIVGDLGLIGVCSFENLFLSPFCSHFASGDVLRTARENIEDYRNSPNQRKQYNNIVYKA